MTKAIKPYIKPYDDLWIESHGGHCCGINHIYGFEDVDLVGWAHQMERRVTLADKVRFIENCIRSVYGEKPRRMALEAVLADFQFHDWEKALQRVGFRRVFSFVNSNTGRDIRVYYLELAKPKTLPKAETERKSTWR